MEVALSIQLPVPLNYDFKCWNHIKAFVMIPDAPQQGQTFTQKCASASPVRTIVKL